MPTIPNVGKINSLETRNIGLFRRLWTKAKSLVHTPKDEFVRSKRPLNPEDALQWDAENDPKTIEQIRRFKKTSAAATKIIEAKWAAQVQEAAK